MKTQRPDIAKRAEAQGAVVKSPVTKASECESRG